MAPSIPVLQRFFYSHYFFGGVRQAIGVIMPALIFGWMFDAYDMGMVASIGAACVAIIDQPPVTRRHGTNSMLGAVLLGTLTVAITGFASTHHLLFWFVIPALAFTFSMFTVYGKQGSLMAFACLLIMTLTMRTTLQTHDVPQYTMYSLMGGCLYFVYSFIAHRIFWLREQQQSLSVALFATADYISVRSSFYDVASDLDANYRNLVRTQSDMTEKQQAARNTLLRELPATGSRSERRRNATINIFVDMVALLDSLVATHTDYATLRRSLPDSDILIFARDALAKLANQVQQIALSIARNQPARKRSSAKAELRAFEFELEQFRQQGLPQNDPEVYALLVQVLRRLRNSARIAARMVDHSRGNAEAPHIDRSQQKTMSRFLSRTDLRFDMMTSNLHLSSPNFRYALRITIATVLALVVAEVLSYSISTGRLGAGIDIHIHGYWIILTVIVIMKPGFALTRQRNGLRLIGTFFGCVLALTVFGATDSHDIYFLVLVVSCVMGYSLVQVNFMAAAVFNTLTVLLVFHLLAPSSPVVVGERLIDTIIGCAIALACSYILPWWEYNFMPALAEKIRQANLAYFKTGLRYADLNRRLSAPDLTAEMRDSVEVEQREAYQQWRLAQKNVNTAFSNYAAAFYRMATEPARRQNSVPELNHLLIQNHVLTSQISAAVPLLAALDEVPPGIEQSLVAIDQLLEDQDATPPLSIETEGELAALAYPLRQMVKAAQLIRQEMRGLETAPVVAQHMVPADAAMR